MAAGRSPDAPRRVADAVGTISRWTLHLLIILAGVAVLGWLLDKVWSIALPILLALLLSAVLLPPVRLLARVMPRTLAALLVLVGLFGLGAGLVRLLTPSVRDQSEGLSVQLGDAVDAVQRWVDEQDDGSTWLSQVFDQAVERVQQNGSEIVSGAVGGVLTGVVGLGSLIVTAVLTLVLSFFIVKDGSRFLPWTRRWAGDRAARHVDELGGRIWGTLSGFVWAQAAVSLVDAVFIGLGLWLLDIPFALVLSILIFFGGFVPIVGAVTTGALAVLVALVSQGFWTAVAVLAIVLVVQQLESNILQPVLVGRVLELHAAVVLSSVTVGGTLFGIVGALLAVPVVSVAVVTARYVRENLADDDPDPAEPESKPTEVAPEPAPEPAERR